MQIPVFVSSPTSLNLKQVAVYRLILGELGHHNMVARAIGTTDYPTSFPLREVFTLARHCSGGVILGFSQFETKGGVWKRGTAQPIKVPSTKKVVFATPWNQLEAGILFSLGVPLLIFREDGISGGVFDNGVTDLFVHPMPRLTRKRTEKKALKSVFEKWTAQVRRHYYNEK